MLNFINIINSKSYSIFSFLEGNSKKRWSGEACYKVGRALANFHKINKNLKIKIKNDFSISFWEKLFLIIKKKKTFNTDFIRNELSYIKKKWPNKLPSGIIHADLFPDNVFFKKNDISGILDFYFSCFDFLIYDLAIVVNAWCFSSGVFQKNKYYKIISGYQSIRKLKTSEIESFNIILRGASLRFFLTRAIDSSVNKKENILVKKKDPEEFYKILKFHKSNENDFKYQ